MVGATVLVLVHWTATDAAGRRSWEVALGVALAVIGLVVGLLEARRLGGMERYS
jgi:hypothetical protein